MTPDKVEEWVEYCAEVCDSVEFLHGVPVQLPSQTKALLRGRVREALTQHHQDMMSEVVEKEQKRIKKLLSLREASPRTDFDSDEEYQLHRQKIGAINWYANLIKGQINLPDLPETSY